MVALLVWLGCVATLVTAGLILDRRMSQQAQDARDEIDDTYWINKVRETQ